MTTTAAEQFADLIRAGRLNKGLTQDQLAEQAGVSRITVLRWENGHADRPEPSAVRAACLALDIAPIEAVYVFGLLERPASPTAAEQLTYVMEHGAPELSDSDARLLDAFFAGAHAGLRNPDLFVS